MISIYTLRLAERLCPHCGQVLQLVEGMYQCVEEEKACAVRPVFKEDSVRSARVRVLQDKELGRATRAWVPEPTYERAMSVLDQLVMEVP